MMEVETLREDLKRFSGNPQYRKFVRTVTTTGKGTGKFLYWQEKLWSRFTSKFPEYNELTHKDLEDALNICYLHLQEFQEDEVKAQYGRWKFPPEYIKARDSSFPYANKIYFGDINAKPKSHIRTVTFCEECRRELVRWNARRKEKFGLD